MNQKTTDLVKLTVTMLSATMLFLATVGIRFDWLTLDSINAFGVFLGAFILWAAVLYGIWMNTYTRWKAFKDAEKKKRSRLTEDRKEGK